MKYHIGKFYLSVILFCCAVVFSSFVRMMGTADKLAMPYKKAGLSNEQAAAHLLSRFTYGAKPGQVEEVVKMGLEKWLKKQLDGNLEDKNLDQMLSQYDAINISNSEVEDRFPQNPRVTRWAIRDGYLNKDSLNTGNNKYQREIIQNYMKEKGYRPLQDLYRQFFNQKILRAAYGENQFREIMTDFWFNHFNVALNKTQCASFVPAYERDVIRPNVFGGFEDLLLTTAKSPAMLMYLDNSSSSGVNVPMADQDMMSMEEMGMSSEQKAKKKERVKKIQQQIQNKKKQGGLNENYAREVMELHTLGVDGGYTQNDVTQAARVLTGWTVAPLGKEGYGAGSKALIERLGPSGLREKGFVLDGDFFFNANRHDNGEKIVLGKKFPAGGGYDEGVELLKMLAHHQSTAKFISKKLAVRFVNDVPPASLLDRMAKTFTSTKGDIKSVIITMVNSPEFWSEQALREKTKSPFELAMSAVRSLNAEITQPYELYSWINRMGQQMYYYQAPTGFPDNGQYWINTGSLLNRMNFGLALASQRIPGVKLNLPALNSNKEPESVEAALLTYSKLIMPERELGQTVARLKPMLNDPNLQQKVAQAAEQNSAKKDNNNSGMEMQSMDKKPAKEEKMKLGNGRKANENPVIKTQAGTNTMLAQVVGVIIGSPEFQRK
ncbi:DUF1800 domain-containing protein [Pedobacter xixiisoli]|uniref:Uncharacterized conserved protein, DUF1800 family n=1 Tax=Pedobacter xixiisoli TaxID=1476464 RepID=A0A286A8P4_9SPHI|nr:DUF1800 domain-containing protein [Pedobacter xixiisoli]SOD18252.1 Uncharacterized conserved protein, DUF1800 family [Pedobacter xixiisoli]